MDTKTVGIIAVVAILLVGGIGAYFLLSDDAEEEKVPDSSIKGRCLVYGNVDNDNHITEADLTLLKQIVADGVWDYKMYPYADANHDGAVDNDDVTYLENILSKEKPTKLYYVGYTATDNVFSMTYPAVGDIACNYYYGFYNCMAIGIYDRITATAEKCTTYKQDMFPGCSKMDIVGTSKFDPELILKHDIKYAMGSANAKMYEQLKGVGCDAIMIRASGVSASGQDVITSVVTLGALFDADKAVDEYVEFFDKVQNEIETKSKSFEREYTYVMPYNPKSYVENAVDTQVRSTGAMLGDVYAMSLLPMEDMVWSANNCCPKIQTEDIIKWDPDFIILSNTDSLNATDDPADVQKVFNQWFDYYKTTNAYKNHKMIGICYDGVGCHFGIGAIPLIASYLWPDVFDEQEGWDIFEEAVHKFTMLKDVDIRDCGGLIVYEMPADL